MLFKSTVASAAMAAALLFLPSAGSAQETHTISPKFPDSFKMRFAMVNDDVEDTMGSIEKSHMELTALATVERQGAGYNATYRIEDMSMQTWDAAGNQTTTAVQSAVVSSLFKAIGVAKVTLDGNLDPVSVDNIEDIKGSIKSLASASGSADEESQNQTQFLLMMVQDLTPQSAADLIKQGRKATSFFNVPLVLNKPVNLPPSEITLMGAVFRTSTVMTLTGWEEGKTARVRYQLVPNDEDMASFVKTLLQALFGEKIESEDAETQATIRRMFDGMKMTMSQTCDVEISLVNYIDTKSDCNDVVTVDLDMKAILTPEMLAANPDAAADMPRITMKQTSHKVSTTSLVD